MSIGRWDSLPRLSQGICLLPSGGTMHRCQSQQSSCSCRLLSSGSTNSSACSCASKARRPWAPAAHARGRPGQPDQGRAKAGCCARSARHERPVLGAQQGAPHPCPRPRLRSCLRCYGQFVLSEEHMLMRQGRWQACWSALSGQPRLRHLSSSQGIPVVGHCRAAAGVAASVEAVPSLCM